MDRKKIYRAVSGFLLQLMGWGILICTAPLITYLAGGNREESFILLNLLFSGIIPVVVIYFVNYYLLIPLIFFRERRIWFVLSNMALMLVVNFPILYVAFNNQESLPDNYRLGIIMGVIVSFIMDLGALGIAIAIRNYLRTLAIRQQLAEETHRRTEAELMWLKNQLNPHFLFNSLNNISSLVCIDPDQAQDSIGQLSDLLRYAIYESEKKSVELGKEIDFMRDYVSLMSLRCNDRTEVTMQIEIADRKIPVVPLLLVSMIENAFKHGVSASLPSFINIRIMESNGKLTLVCENSDHHKPANDLSGSGIGMLNMKKRLELTYPGRYTWHQVTDGNVFHVEVTINLNDKLQ